MSENFTIYFQVSEHAFRIVPVFYMATSMCFSVTPTDPIRFPGKL